MKKLLQLLLLVFCYHSHVFPQELFMSTEYAKRLDKIFVSPQVGAFQKYTYYPVSPSTGTTNIQVPIYTVTQGALILLAWDGFLMQEV